MALLAHAASHLIAIVADLLSPIERTLRTIYLAYLCAGFVSIGATALIQTAVGTPLSPWQAALIADLIATVVIFGFSHRYGNASIYDPYWSVAPILITIYFAIEGSLLDLRSLSILGAVGIWGMRLTVNWVLRWRGLTDEDWRYGDLRTRSGRLYPLVNLFGIHLLPTLLVFLAVLPLYLALCRPERSNAWLDLIAATVTAIAIGIEWLSDRQLRTFLQRRSDRSQQLDSGLWGWSRHPNYFGEVLFWWGIWLFGLSAAPSQRWAIIAPIAMTALFVLYSVPAMDQRMLASNPDFARRMKRVSGLIPLPPRRDS